ncbi:hypothetical protein VOLCADRAFT_105176 [Volvox carteri f. nagariensis]|uniref:Plasma membrane ATPase n=1 Tax=Volvox carteri f. nagariensis TaxID=3068 RepID=D8TZ21_VOLCA|nr:uncharacterized protein VOLCADRAFT_105176 [Volvox carteri f. nagariensis]EFJ47104.1 hypothetical protein VOLCADRAFT_105176 [Volvox carteri f. nagariensis]|eukprot:XP_002951653.1 hypothetical protein VOLCADRAFT_105176 [Volvox carteri f. nagariensis]
MTENAQAKETVAVSLDHEGEGPRTDFTPSVGISSEAFVHTEAAELLKHHGRNELEEKVTPSWLIFLRQLYQPMPIMIWIAAIIEGAIQNWPDFGILLGIQFINATLGWYETTKAGNAVAALKASLKPQATAKRDGKWVNLDAALLVPGDLVLLGSGSNVPADCLINHGTIDVDQAALTGESLPVTMHMGDSAKMGSTVVRGETEATVEFTGKNTFFGKTAAMLQQGGDELGHLQKILLKIMVVLVVTSLALCGTAFGYLMGMGEDGKEALSFTVVLLVASIPIAIEIVCTTTLALGSRELSAHGAIVTRLAAIEDMAGMNMLCSDKTGTLTLNKMVIQEDTPTYLPGLDQARLLNLAALAAKWKEPPRDALDTLVLLCEQQDLSKLDVYEQIDYMPFDPTIKRTEGTIRDTRTGKVFKVSKGAPHIILKLCPDQRVHHMVEETVSAFGLRGIRCLAIARTMDDDTWHMAGLLTFLDPPRPDTKVTIHKAMAYGVDVKMITGDNLLIAKETARVLGMGTNIQDPKSLPSMDAEGKAPKDLGKKYGKIIMEADGFAQVYPEHKYLIVEALRQNGFAVGMTGDGVNDAPALKRADVGVAVQGATDAARAAADIVLTQPGLSTIVTGIVTARCIFQRMKNFINYRIAATLQLLVFFFIAVLTLKPADYEPPPQPCEHNPKELCDAEFPNFFKMPVLMLMLITLLNDGTLISIGYDHVKPTTMPEKWNLPALFVVSIVLGMVACGSSLLLLWAALDSWNPDGIFHKWGIGRMSYGKITTMIYLKVSVSDFLTLFSARTHDGFFWSSKPSPVLMCAALLALSISTILACVWPKGQTDHTPTEGLAYGDYTLMPLWIWIYCIFWWFVQDALKVLTYWVMHKLNLFDINSALVVNKRDATNVHGDPLARHSVGLVEGKLLAAKVGEAQEKIAHVMKQEGALGRFSANLMRASANLAQISTNLKQGGHAVKGDMEDGVASLEQAVGNLEVATSDLDPKMRGEINPVLEGVRDAAERLAANTAAGLTGANTQGLSRNSNNHHPAAAL